jgi:mRNA deadenylase 3'-5' endonuclease subunit Ccr4
MTWNILANKFLPDSKRSILIVDLIIDSQSDIICLQEVTLKTAHIDFKRLFEKYDYHIHQINKKRTNSIGNMTFWNKSKLTRIPQIKRKHNFNSTSIHVLLTFNNYNFWISNIHLKAGLKTHEDTRVCQLKSTLKESPILPCCIVGDFNDDLDSNGKLYHLLSEYKFEINIFNKGCFARSKFYAFDHAVVRGVKLKKIRSNQTLQPIPNKNWPSDHLLQKFILF